MGAPKIRALVIGDVSRDYVMSICSRKAHDTHESGFEFRVRKDDSTIEQDLIEFAPHAILTVPGAASQHAKLSAQPLDVRRMWMDCLGQAPARVGELILGQFSLLIDDDRFREKPLVSVFTPTYRTGKQIERAYTSIKNQTYGNWEWVVYDDSEDDETARCLKHIADKDHRVRVFCGHRHSGSIGDVKRCCAGLCRGEILVELDHDDELTSRCLDAIVAAFNTHPEAGFAYTHAAELLNKEPVGYPEGWGMGYGSQRIENVDGIDRLVMLAPPINAKTIRHITACPNHARAWRRSAYWLAGGHNHHLRIADDYDLIVRTFLVTRFVRIDMCGYIQHYHGSNAQNSNRADIQRIVHLIWQKYESRIHDRLLALGVPDFIKTKSGFNWDLTCDVKQHCNIEFPGGKINPATLEPIRSANIAVITACTRPENLEKIHASLGTIPVHWVVVVDRGVVKDPVAVPDASVHRITVLKEDSDLRLPWHAEAVKNVGIDYVMAHSREDWIYILDDDNLMYPDFVQSVSKYLTGDADIVAFSQDRCGGVHQAEFEVGKIDQAQYIVRTACIGDKRIPNHYTGDGLFVTGLSKDKPCRIVQHTLCYYNKLA